MEQCQDIVERLTPYVDGALDAAETEAVGRHLAGCVACRERTVAERAGRDLVRAHAIALRATAPPALRARLVPARPHVVAFRPRRTLWRAVPLSAAAALLLAVLSVFAVGLLAPQGTLLAAQLTVDHVKCLLLDHSHVPAEKAALEAHWEARHGWPVEIPAGDAERHLDLVGIRQCLFEGGTMAHVLYRQGSRTYSLFIMRGERSSAPVLEIMGHGTIAWRGAGRTYALVTDGPAGDEAHDVARYFMARVR